MKRFPFHTGIRTSSLALIFLRTDLSVKVWSIFVVLTYIKKYLYQFFIDAHIILIATTSSVDSIKYYLDSGDAAILKVSEEPHYVLGYGYTGSTYFVLDPRNQRRSYKTSEVSQAVIYSRPYWCKD
jgi:hypothetical protein